MQSKENHFCFPPHITFQVEICRFGCPDHCQKPNSYQAREQEVSSSINIPQYRPGPRYEAQKAATAAKRVDTREELSNEIPTDIRRVPEAAIRRVPEAGALPQPQRLVQDAPEALPKAPEPYQTPAAHLVKNLPPPQKQAPPRYQPRPQKLPARNPSPSLPETEKSANPQLFFTQPGRQTEKSSSKEPFFKLPQFKLPKFPPFPWGNKEEQFERVESEIEDVPMGIPPLRRTASVPVSRTRNGEQPQVFPSGFNNNAQPVRPIEPLESSDDSQFPYGPRGLKFNKRSVRERRDIPEEMGVNSGYQVISEVDLAFKPSFEDGMGVTVFQVWPADVHAVSQY